MTQSQMLMIINVSFCLGGSFISSDASRRSCANAKTLASEMWIKDPQDPRGGQGSLTGLAAFCVSVFVGLQLLGTAGAVSTPASGSLVLLLHFQTTSFHLGQGPSSPPPLDCSG